MEMHGVHRHYYMRPHTSEKKTLHTKKLSEILEGLQWEKEREKAEGSEIDRKNDIERERGLNRGDACI